MAEDRPQPPTEDFDARLRDARRREGQAEFEPRQRLSGPGMGLAFRVSTEFVAAVAVSVGIGWLLDSWLDTKPWFLILFVLLGAVAGTLNVYRTVTAQQKAAGN